MPIENGVAPSLRFVARRGADSVSRTIPLRRAGATAAVPQDPTIMEGPVRSWERWVRMRRLPSDTADSATQWRPIYSRWRPGGEVALPLPQGMRLRAEVRTNHSIGLAIAPGMRVWIPAVDADSGAPARAPLLRAGAPLMREQSDGLLLSIPLPERLPTTVELSGERLLWTVYGAEWATRPDPRDGNGKPVRRMVPRDSSSGRLVVDLGLSELPLGWRTEWHGGMIHLRVRRVPVPSTSLRGLVVVLDAGHPPHGTIGPSGLEEDSVTLAVARAAAAQLKARGATVILTRSTPAAVSLEARAVVAEQTDAHLFISIHVNAPGPGRPPGAVYGTQTFWTNPNGRALARLLLNEVSKSMAQPAIGSYQTEFAVLRPAWTTAVLVEGTGIVIPEREAFLRTQAGVEAYAAGIVNAVARWHRSAAVRTLPASRPRQPPPLGGAADGRRSPAGRPMEPS
ncbi:MAG: N-acetylmuramoyl-L-alanine amidase [Gemmatimonadaceae bacterium]